MSSPLIALCVGHSRIENGRTEGGAISAGGISEHAYNTPLADQINYYLNRFGIASFIVSYYKGNGYTAAQQWLAGELKKFGATLALELHFNASEGQARGAEWLHWGSSVRGKILASCLRSEFLAGFPEAIDRGLKPKVNGDRGAEFLKGTHCPAVICEPFFGDNAADWQMAVAKKDQLALAIANGIVAYLAK